ncbi:MAG: hypothetical protein ACI8ZM_001754 [Crocinitomix sp.]|jgi:hypothetical protein
MMKLTTLTTLFIFIFSSGSIAQSNDNDKGNVNIHFGTLMVYSTYSIGYESFGLLKNIGKHQVRPVIRIGGWQSSYAEQNKGVQSSLGITYLFGGKSHFIEHSSEIVTHFDKGLKGQSIVFIGAMYRPYLGYRYQPLDKKIIAKIGVGWKELIQIGFGLRF